MPSQHVDVRRRVNSLHHLRGRRLSSQIPRRASSKWMKPNVKWSKMIQVGVSAGQQNELWIERGNCHVGLWIEEEVPAKSRVNHV